jgi:hypothetical protein
MSGWHDSTLPTDDPPPPPHVVDPEQFPAPTEEDLSAAMAAKDLAYLASLILLRSSPETRVLASLVLRVLEARINETTKPPTPGSGVKAV